MNIQCLFYIRHSITCHNSFKSLHQLNTLLILQSNWLQLYLGMCFYKGLSARNELQALIKRISKDRFKWDYVARLKTQDTHGKQCLVVNIYLTL